MSADALGVGQLVGDPEGLNTLLVAQQADRPGPVRAPQAARKAVGVEDLSQGLPNVCVGEWLVRQGARPGNLDGDIVMRGQGDDLTEIGKGLGRRGRLEGLVQADMVHNDLGVGVPARQLSQQRQFSPAQHVDRQAVPRPGRQYPMQPRIVGRRVTHQHDARPDHAWLCRPFGNLVG